MISDELDKELQDSAQSEVSALRQRLETVERDLLTTLLPEEPADERNVILEVRAGAGGTEASFFAGELFHMYKQYAGVLLNSFPAIASKHCCLSFQTVSRLEACLVPKKYKHCHARSTSSASFRSFKLKLHRRVGIVYMLT